DGVPLGGTSAGLAVLGQYLFSAEHDTIVSKEALEDPYHPAITLEKNFIKAEPLSNLITDSHFSQRDRLGRLLTFVARVQQDENLTTLGGVGVDEATAALVDSEGSTRVVGEGSAHFVKARSKPRECRPGKALSHSYSLHSVSAGQTFELADWSSREVEPRSVKVDHGELR
ncbi:MAG: hypothetical protein KC800_34105, partial [Candidatus Eremiobacteraeota bacterium]|nr:hypothetical protein [Candidatus Eremiobacteraeota bacterium]